MIRILILFFIIAINTGFSQNTVSGTVIDSDTREPIENVVMQNRRNGNIFTYTDSEGHFSILSNVNDTLNVNIMGYEKVFFVCNDDTASTVIALHSVNYELPEVTITFENAMDILRKAFSNVLNNYSKEELHYLWHGMEKEKNSDELMEGHALYSANWKKSDTKKNIINFDLNMIEINNNKQAEYTSNILKNNRFSDHFHAYIPVLKLTDREYRVVGKENVDDTLMIISFLPKDIKNRIFVPKYEAVIDKTDTTLLSFSSENANPIAEDAEIEEYDKGKILFLTVLKLKVRDYTVKFQTKKTDAGYYFDNYYSRMLISFLVHDREELVESINESKRVYDVPQMKNKTKKVINSSRQLFNLPSTTSDH
ncbi:MAG: carboxypeptidase-like regulatory domain-containing protein [Tannerella sp.]|jgi:hypothetical protein|nr:carboxypeptidase-like regulatory domain-containing protein [Tannerella sp.]